MSHELLQKTDYNTEFTADIVFELFGRRPIYFGSMISFILFTVPCSIARDIQTLLVARFFEGFAGAAFLSVAGGTVGDLFTHHELGPPMLLYTLSPL